MADQLPQALKLLTQRNGDLDPGNDIELITLTIGGNDLFDPVVGNCLGGLNPTCSQAIQTVFTTFGADLGLILGRDTDCVR
jgi:hypothetical protein